MLDSSIIIWFIFNLEYNLECLLHKVNIIFCDVLTESFVVMLLNFLHSSLIVLWNFWSWDIIFKSLLQISILMS